MTKVVNRNLGAVFDVYVGRPSDFGNPYSVARGRKTLARFEVATLSEALRGYEEWLAGKPELIRRVREELRGKKLGCWCVMDLTGKEPIVCHAQILARVADGVKFPIFDKGMKS